MLKPLFFTVAIFICLAVFSQTYTISKSGPNTWGGAYIPPVWSKTYDFSVPAYKSPTMKSGTSTSSASSYSGGSLSGYTKKGKSSIQASDDYSKWAQVDKVVKEVVDKYFSDLDTAIKLFNEGSYKESHTILVNIHLTTFAKLDNYSVQGAHEKHREATKEYTIVEYCYIYFCEVKLHEYNKALETYNMFLSSYQKISNPLSEKEPFPFQPEYYYVFDSSLTRTDRHGFKDIILHDRFRADLFFVETLAGLGKMKQATEYMNMTMQFYVPLFKEIDYYCPQIGINYFYLGNAEESRKYFEHYYNKTQSNTARFTITNELIENQSMARNWHESTSPGCYKIVEDNMLFLDGLQEAEKVSTRAYSIKNWYELFIKRGNHPDKLSVKVEPSLEKEFAKRARGELGYWESELSYYMTALLKSGDETTLKKMLERLVVVADICKRDFQKKAEEELKQHKKHRLEMLEMQLKNPASFSYKSKTSAQIKDIKEQESQKYWHGYYEQLSRPYALAVSVFDLAEFCEAGGDKLLIKYVQPYLDELENFTAEEIGVSLGICKFNPKFKKSRKYPSSIE